MLVAFTEFKGGVFMYEHYTEHFSFSWRRIFV